MHSTAYQRYIEWKYIWVVEQTKKWASKEGSIVSISLLRIRFPANNGRVPMERKEKDGGKKKSGAALAGAWLYL